MKIFPTVAARATPCLAALLCLGSIKNVKAGVYVDHFDNGINPTYWTTQTSTSNLYSVDATHGNVHFAKNPAVTSSGGFQYVRDTLKLPALGGNITGDFSTQIAFSNAAITGTVFNQVQFEAGFADGAGFLDVFDNFGGNGISINAHVWDGSTIQGAIPLPITTTSGVLRIERIGTIVTGYYNDQAIFSEKETSALTAIRFTLQNNHDNATIAVTFDDFSLTAASVPEPATGALALIPATLMALGRRHKFA